MQIDIQGNADRVYEAIIEIDRRIFEVFGYTARKIAPVPGIMSLKEGFLEVHYKIFGLKKPTKEESYYHDLVLSYTDIMTDYIVEHIRNPILRKEGK